MEHRLHEPVAERHPVGEQRRGHPAQRLPPGAQLRGLGRSARDRQASGIRVRPAQRAPQLRDHADLHAPGPADQPLHLRLRLLQPGRGEPAQLRLLPEAAGLAHQRHLPEAGSHVRLRGYLHVAGHVQHQLQLLVGRSGDRRLASATKAAGRGLPRRRRAHGELCRHKGGGGGSREGVERGILLPERLRHQQQVLRHGGNPGRWQQRLRNGLRAPGLPQGERHLGDQRRGLLGSRPGLHQAARRIRPVRPRPRRLRRGENVESLRLRGHPGLHAGQSGESRSGARGDPGVGVRLRRLVAGRPARGHLHLLRSAHHRRTDVRRRHPLPGLHPAPAQERRHAR